MIVPSMSKRSPEKVPAKVGPEKSFAQTGVDERHEGVLRPETAMIHYEYLASFVDRNDNVRDFKVLLNYLGATDGAATLVQLCCV